MNIANGFAQILETGETDMSLLEKNIFRISIASLVTWIVFGLVAMTTMVNDACDVFSAVALTALFLFALVPNVFRTMVCIKDEA